MANDNLQVFGVMTRKGGAGKTALTRALASAAINSGKTVYAIDADPQQALARWYERGDLVDDNLIVESLEDVAELEDKIDDAYRADFDYVFIDTQGSGGAWADKLVTQCNYIVTPMMLSHTDMEMTKDTYNWWNGLKDRTSNPELLPSMSVVFARVPSKPTAEMKRIGKNAMEELPVIPTLFMERAQHADSDRDGLLHLIRDQKAQSNSPLLRRHASYFAEAVEEAAEILEQIMKNERTGG